MSLDTIRTLYGHHWWANRTLLDVTAKLGEDVAAREIGKQFSEPTLKRMFLHVYGVDLLWLSRWRGVSSQRDRHDAHDGERLAAGHGAGALHLRPQRAGSAMIERGRDAR